MTGDGFEAERARFAVEIDEAAIRAAGGYVIRNDDGEIQSFYIPGDPAEAEDDSTFPDGWTELGYTTEDGGPFGRGASSGPA